MSRYVINVLASQDLNEIADYFAENSLEAGERFFRAFNSLVSATRSFPRQRQKLRSNSPWTPRDISGRLYHLLQNSGRWHRNPDSCERSP